MTSPSGQVHVEQSVVLATAGRVKNSSDTMRGTATDLQKAADGVLSSSWVGGAADVFRNVMADVKTTAEKIVTHLNDMGQNIDKNSQAVDSQQSDASSSITRAASAHQIGH